MSELLSCPFCGVENTDVGYINHTRECYLKRSWFGDKKQFLIESWNTRPLEDALRAQLVAAEERERWIPVSEKLPDHSNGFSDSVLLLIRAIGSGRPPKLMTVSRYIPNDPFYPSGWPYSNNDLGQWGYEAIAWMPLPEPPTEAK